MDFSSCSSASSGVPPCSAGSSPRPQKQRSAPTGLRAAAGVAAGRPSFAARAAAMDATVDSAFAAGCRLPAPGLRVLLLAGCFLGSIVAPSVVLFVYAPESPVWVKTTFAVTSAVIAVLALPTWVVLLFWREKEVRGGGDRVLKPVDVDVVVTTYTEEIDEIAGTLAAIQNIEYAGKVNVYVLDDARRPDVAELCRGVRKSCVGREQVYPVYHITRESNKGKKGGNLNNFLSMPRTADFFVTLDCDMRPFPNMLNLLLGHYYSFEEGTQRRLAFIQSPQFFRNYDAKHDAFDLCSMHFIRTILNAMDTLSTVPYIGTSAMWRRDAIERAGGFVEEHATEDVVTGCNVHQTDNEFGERYISKLLPVPVAAGLSPRTLPELMDQRTRWSVGLVQMAAYHRMFLFCRGLSPIQRIAYFATCGGWISYLLSYLLVLVGTIFTNVSTAWFGATGRVDEITPIWCVAVILSVVLQPVIFLLLPGASVLSRLRGIQMGFVYTSTQLVGLLQTLGLRVSIRHASDSKGARWHGHFWMHLSVYAMVIGSGVTAIVMQARAGGRNAAPYVQVGLLMVTWTFVFWPICLSLFGYQAQENLIWLGLEEGRADLFEEPVFAASDRAALEQMKTLVIRLAQRVEEQDRILSQQLALTPLGSVPSSEDFV